MGAKKRGKVQARVIKAQEMPVRKADASTQITTENAYNAGEWIEPPAPLEGYEALVSESSILPQCIRAYKNNIPGYGIGVRYLVDEEETPEMIAEFERAEEIIELLTIEQDTKELFEDLIEARERFGIAYLEVIRNLAGEVVQVEFIKDIPDMRKTIPLAPYEDYTYYHHGEMTVRKKKFRKYRQQVGGSTVYYKEFGDPRIMDNRSGQYVSDGLERKYQANEILEFALGTKPYGEVRWIGQLLGVDGSRRAENLNNNYFVNGRHTPLLITVNGGTLTDESFAKLQNYMNEIKGEAGQHAFLVLETENADGRADFDEAQKPEIEIKDLASILQKDELFQEYLENNRRRVQSAFQLPDLYVGYTTDFNRATSQTAQEVTEEQVFQPERKSLAWAINNKLLNGYQFKYVEAYFMTPDITNPDDLFKLMSVCNNAGGVTPNLAKDVISKALGITSEPYDGDWGDEPISVSKSREGARDINSMMGQLSGQIAKATKNGENDEVIAVMKEVKKMLRKMQEG
ncbi:MAG: phage portal protein [Eubacteriales bacterium]|nr:phage portal protein [Eubacteriales bacterium]